MRDGDHLPLQPLGGVHGEDLHPVLADGQLGGCEPVLDVHGRVEKGEQAGDRRRRARSEVSHHVGERIEVLGTGPARGNRLRGPDFGVDAQGAAHFGDELGKGMVQLAPQSGQLPAEPHDPGVAG